MRKTKLPRDCNKNNCETKKKSEKCAVMLSYDTSHCGTYLDVTRSSFVVRHLMFAVT